MGKKRKITFFSNQLNNNETDYIPRHRFRIKGTSTEDEGSFTAHYAGNENIHQKALASSVYYKHPGKEYGMAIGVGIALIGFMLHLLNNAISSSLGRPNSNAITLANTVLLVGLAMLGLCWGLIPNYDKLEKKALTDLLQQADKEVDTKMELGINLQP
jgi:hypothetical protein